MCFDPRTDHQFSGEVRDTLTQQWGPRYGWAILTEQLLESPNADTVARAITSKLNGLIEFQELSPSVLKKRGSNENKVLSSAPGAIIQQRLLLPQSSLSQKKNPPNPREKPRLIPKPRVNWSPLAEPLDAQCGLPRTTKGEATAAERSPMIALRNYHEWVSATKPQSGYPSLM